jgi:hypothetical protein
MKKFLKSVVVAMSMGLASTASAGIFSDDAEVASRNLSKAADNFEILRRVVFMNGITDRYMLEIIGLCSIVDQHNQLEVTCKTDEGFKKHFLGLSDNVTYFVEQIAVADVSVNHYRVTFKPQALIPDFDLRGDWSDLFTNTAK